MAAELSPLSPNQARYLRAELLTGASYHLPVSFYLSTSVGVEQLKSAMLKLMQQHAALRTRIVKSPNGEYQQYFAEIDDFSITTIDANAEIKSNPKAYIEAFCLNTSDLNKQSLIKCLLIKLDEEQSVFTISLHHIIADGRSLCLVIEALNRILKEPDAFHDHSDYQQALFELNELTKTKGAQAEVFWRDYLASATEANIPSDYGVTKSSSQHESVSGSIASADVKALSEICSNAGISIFHLLSAVYACLLGRQTGELDLLTAFQSHGRQHLIQHRDCLGLFARTLVLRHKLSANLSILELAKIIKYEISQAVENQTLSYDAILNLGSYKPRFSINHFPTLPALEINAVSYTAQRIATWHSDFDLNLHFETTKEGMDLTLFFNAGLFTSTRAATMLEQIKMGLLQLLIMPNLKLCEFALMPNLVKKQTLISNDALFGSRIENAFFKQAALYPERVAIRDELQTWSYRDVALGANHIRGILERQGLGSHKRIAIFSSQSPLLVTSMLAVLRLGAAFCVLDPKLPSTRLLQFVKILQPDFIVSIAEGDWLAQTGIDRAHLNLAEIQNAISKENTIQISDSAENTELNANEPAYFLFTSGTTGEPKCVVHTHAPLIHHIQWQQQNFSLNQDTRVTMLSGLMHDPLLRDVFVPLSIGGSVCVASAKTLNQPRELREWLQLMMPTVMHTTPSMLLWLNDASKLPCNSLRLCLIGGESLYAKHIEIFRAIAPSAALVNVYGTTETPQVMAWHQLGSSDSTLVTPAGQAVPDVEIQVLSDLSKEASPYAIGEIVIKTPYLSAGYLAPNASQKVTMFNDHTYPTGDMGYLNAAGELVVVGRSDDQIKIRGFRVSLSEIEQSLSAHPDILESACVFYQGRIVAVVVAKSRQQSSELQVQEYLDERLPDYMHVQTVMFLLQLPRLNNHKPDKQALYPLIENNQAAQLNNLLLPENDNEIAITEAWGGILGQQFISVDATFVGLGGDSLSFIQASLALERIIGFIPDDWQQLSIRKLSTMTQAQSPWVYVHSAVLVRAISIVFVLIGHFFDRSLTGGTDALFLIAGYSFAGFQLKTIELKKSVKPIFYTIASIAIPTLIISLVHFYKIRGIDIPRVFFYGNFILPYNELHEPQYELFWFIDVLIQILLVMAALFSFASIRDRSEQQPFRFASTVLVIAIVIALIGAQLWDTAYLLDRVPQAKLWLFALGWGVYFAHQKQQKWIYALLGLSLPILLEHNISPIMSVCTLLLLFVPNIKLVRPLHTWVYAVASASLMIYLTHFQINSVLERLGINDKPYISLIAGVIGGVVLWRAWQWVTARFKRYWFKS